MRLLDESAEDRVAQAEAAIRRQVLHDLGRPGTPLRVRVMRLWDRHYRVNVYAGADGPSPTITHSYFIAVDDTGTVLESTPAFRRPPANAGAAGGP